MLKNSSEFTKIANEGNSIMLSAADTFFSMDDDSSDSIEISHTETEKSVDDELLENLIQSSSTYMPSTPINIPTELSTTETEPKPNSATEYFERRLRSSADDLNVGSPPQKITTPKNNRRVI